MAPNKTTKEALFVFHFDKNLKLANSNKINEYDIHVQSKPRNLINIVKWRGEARTHYMHVYGQSSITMNTINYGMTIHT